MARQQERLVKGIRARRRALVRSVQDVVGPLEPLRDNVRRHPSAWAVGGALVGLVATRAFGASLARGGRRLAGTWIEQRFGDAILGVAMKAAAVVRSEFHAGPQNGNSAEPGSAASGKGHAAAVEPEGQEAFPGS